MKDGDRTLSPSDGLDQEVLLLLTEVVRLPRDLVAVHGRLELRMERHAGVVDEDVQVVFLYNS